MLALVACSRSRPSSQPDAAPVGAPPGATNTPAARAAAGNSSCGAASASSFADPQLAYAAYAEAVNAADWCRAIQTFASDARAEVAVMNFKTLALAAGADNPKRAAYQQQFSRFCADHALTCGSPESATALAQGLMLRMPLDAELSEIRALASRQPEALYVALLQSIAAADPGAMSRFDVPLRDLTIEGEHATGKAPQSDGRVSPLPFVKSGTGWSLAAR